MKRLSSQRAAAISACLLVACSPSARLYADGEARPRIRELGVEPGTLQPGPLNAITDVEGVSVGHRTLIWGDSVRTGVTVILPHQRNLFQEKVPAAAYVANGFGKAAGLVQVQELGVLETPIVLTNTLSVGTAVQALVDWTLRQPGNEEVESVNALVGETNDGDLNDIRGAHVRPEDIWRALEDAVAGPVTEGNVGGGTGTRALGWKAGIGSASRVLSGDLDGVTVGALVQSNFGGTLRIDGYRVDQSLDPRKSATRAAPAAPRSEAGSVIIVLATDAPLGSRNLERLARRAVLALGRVGSLMSNGSGDFVIAFSTAGVIPHSPRAPRFPAERLHNDFMSPLFLAAVEATEEAIYNSLLKAETMTGQGGLTVEALPIRELERILAGRSAS